MNDSAPSRPTFRLDNIFYGWWILLACFVIGIYVAAVTFYGFTAFFDPLVREFGWSYTEISFAMSLRGIEMSLLAPLVGFLVDRYGPRRLALLGVIAVGLGFFVLSLTRSLWMFYGSFILIGFGGGGCSTVVLMRVVTNWFRKRVGMALGILTSGFGASGLLVPVVVWLIDAFGWREALIILGGGMLVIGVPLVFVIRDTPEEYGLCPDGRKTERSVEGKPGGEEGATEEVSFRDALRHRAFRYLALTETIRGMAIGAVIIHIMPYMNLLHIPRKSAGLIAGLIPLLSILGRFGFGWLADYADKRYIITIASGLMSLGMFTLCYVNTGWGMILFLLLFPLGFGGVITLRGAMLREYFGRGAFGRLIGLVTGAAALGGIIGPTLAGFIFDTTGSYYITWIAIGIPSSVSAFLMLRVERKISHSY
jgi:OFA family oxalate/formate antiporter-like MFS transporter